MSAPRKNTPVRDFALLRLMAGVVLLTGGLPGLILVIVASTWTGRLCGLLVLAASALPRIGCTALMKRTRIHVLTTWMLAAAAGVLALVIVSLAPPRRTGTTARVSNEYATGGVPSRLAPSNLVPEVDQLMLGFTLAALTDPLFTLHQAAELKQLTAEIYRELDADPEFAALGSAMGSSYADMAGIMGGDLHAYVYVPARCDRTRPSPVLVFFHGSGGNFKGYLWILAQVAEQLGYIVVAPSGGEGRWKSETTLRALDGALDLAARRAAIDRAQVYVMGVSNGGLAVSQIVQAKSKAVRSLVFVSPVFDEMALEAAEPARLLAGHRVLVVTGDYDDRVPPDYVRAEVSDLRQAGAAVDYHTVPANHFLFFSHRRELVALITDWFGAEQPGAASTEPTAQR